MSFTDVACEPDGLLGDDERERFGARCDAMVGLLGQRPVSVLLCDDRRIRQLNAQWRHQDKPTDVLSFALDEADSPQIMAPEGLSLPLGDVVISTETAGRQANEHGWDLESELTFLFAHGLCHLVGHDHAEVEQAAAMASEETRLMAIFGLTRPSGLSF